MKFKKLSMTSLFITGFACGMKILEWHGISLVKNQGFESMEFYKWHGKDWNFLF